MHQLSEHRFSRKGVQNLQKNEAYIRHIEGRFDSFCKTVLKNRARDWYRRKKRRNTREILFSEITGNTHINQPYFDHLEWTENYTLDNLELVVSIENDALAQALKKLSRRKRQIILLSYFAGLTDREIAEKMNEVRSTIQSARTKALREMRESIEEQS